MVLISRLPRHHTTRQFRAAARQRFEEATRAANAGDRLVGVYLWGYAAEMLLKAAYFRLDGRRPSDPITLRDLRDEQGYAITTLNVRWQGGNLHDLNRWAELLYQERHRRGVPYPAGFGTNLLGQVASIYANWREHICYHTNRPRPGEVAATFRAASWLIANDSDL